MPVPEPEETLIDEDEVDIIQSGGVSGGGSGGATRPLLMSNFVGEPWLPKWRSNPGSSRERPFHLLLILR